MLEVRKKIDTIFKKRIPSWETLSDLDPTKILATALSESIHEAKNLLQQERTATMEMLPGLVGFPRKQAISPLVLLRGTLRPSQLTRVELPEAMKWEVTHPSLSPGHILEARVSERQILDPIEFMKRGDQRDVTILEIKYRGPVQKLRLFAKTDSFIQGDLCIEVDSVHGTDDKVRIPDSDFQIKIEPIGAYPLHRIDIDVLPRWRSQEYQIEIRSPSFQKIQWEVNLVIAKLIEVQLDQPLGLLTPNPWSRLPLPSHVVTIPETIELEFSINRLQQFEVIRDPLDQNAACVYNSTHHSLDFPLLLDSFKNRLEPVPVQTSRLEMIPQSSTIRFLSQGGTDVLLGKYSQFLNEIRLVESIHPGQVFESLEEYQNRFYDGLQSFLSDYSRANLNPKKLRTQVVNEFDFLKSAEIQPSPNQVTVFFEIRNYDKSKVNVANEIRTFLEKKLQLDLAISVLPFRVLPIEVILRFNCSESSSRPRRQYHSILQSLRRSFARWPYGTTETGEILTTDKMLQELDRQHPEIQILDMKWINLQTGEFLSRIRLDANTLIKPEIRLEPEQNND